MIWFLTPRFSEAQPDGLCLYASWSLEKPKIPLRSRLYHLEPIGLETLMVESLTSYITRLATAHCLATGVLMEREFTKYIQKLYGVANLYKIYHATTALNGTGLMATEIIQVLEQLTLHNNLRSLTLLTWFELLPSRNLLRSSRAWCPICYEVWRHSEQTLYEPLLWSLKAVKVCPQHSQPLKQECPHCYKNSVVLAWQSQSGIAQSVENGLVRRLKMEPYRILKARLTGKFGSPTL